MEPEDEELCDLEKDEECSGVTDVEGDEGSKGSR